MYFRLNKFSQFSIKNISIAMSDDLQEDGQTEPRRGKVMNKGEKQKFKDPLMNIVGEETDDADGELESLDLDASCKSDASMSRSSSLNVNLSGYDDNDAETHDMSITVDDPEKHSGTMDSYVTFRITLKTTRTEFVCPEYEVRRRYNDFLWLRQKLEETYPTHVVPPMPEKHSLRRLDRFSPEFLRIRALALQKFVNRVADHPVQSFDKNFHIFLTAKAWEFQSHKKQSTGLLGRVSDSLYNMGSSYMLKYRKPEFAAIQDYILAFGEKLANIERITQRIVKEQTDFHTDLLEWGPIYTLWSNSEDQLVSSLHSMTKAVETSSASLKELIDATEDHFNQPLREYILYTECIKTVLRRRDAIQAQYEQTLDELNKRKEERDQLKISDQTYSLGAFLGKDPDEVKQNKQDKLEQQVKELTTQMEVLNDKSAVCDTDLRADMERWQKNKHRDMKELFMEAADRNVRYYETCLKAWEDTIHSIQGKDFPVTACDKPEREDDKDKDDDILLEKAESTETDKTASDLS
ncbi:sorting nexin-30-like isoform X2 [Dreissena polymorpha]|uniref:sorting nexin-30-like isoform X2 n=1 Tax=Dreissena polymorpha TaxID=45954 RepID=UPI0022640C18|nr:sorting nexin-30-like isoform X2 [Dreissena polymorpha]